MRDYLKDIIIQHLGSYENKSAEYSLLLIDLLNCPYLGKTDDDIVDFKRKILNEFGFFEQGTFVNVKTELIKNISKYNSLGFFKWLNFDLGIELNT